MFVKSISFPTYLEDIEDIEDDNIDVFVELENDHDYIYTVVVVTVKNIKSLMMDKQKMNYLRPVVLNNQKVLTITDTNTNDLQ